MEKAILINTLIPTACYCLNALMSAANKDFAWSLMWAGYAIANCAVAYNQFTG